jgi:hypothetical protein
LIDDIPDLDDATAGNTVKVPVDSIRTGCVHYDVLVYSNTVQQFREVHMTWVLLAMLLGAIPPGIEDGFDHGSEFESDESGFMVLLKSWDRHEFLRSCLPVPGEGFLLIGNFLSDHSAVDTSFASTVMLDLEGNPVREQIEEWRCSRGYSSVAPIPGGGFMLTGNVYDSGEYSSTLTILSSDLEVLGTVEHPWEELDFLTPSGGRFIAAASSGDYISFGMDRIIALDGDGTVLWDIPFASEGEDFCTSISPMPNGDVLLAGINSPADGELFEGTCIVVRMNGNGDVIWRTDTGLQIHYDCEAAVCGDGRIVVGTGNWQTDGTVIAGMSPDGDVSWTSEIDYGERYSMSLRCFHFTADGSILVGGALGDIDSGMIDYLFLMDLDGNGVPRGGIVLRVPGYGASGVLSVCDRDGGYLVLSKAANNTPDIFDVLVLGMDTDLDFPTGSLEVEEIEFEEMGDRVWKLDLPDMLLR